MADLMSLYADLHGVRAQDPALRGITQADVLGDDAAAMLALQRALEYQSRDRGGGAAGGMGRAADRLRAHRQEETYLDTLRGAMDKQQGIDQYAAQIMAIQQQIAAEEERAMKEQAAVAGGYSPGQAQAVAMGIPLPKPPTAPRGVIADIPDGRGGLRKVLLDPTTGQPMQDYGTVPQTGAAKAPSYMDLVNPQTGATEKRMVGPDGRPGEVIGVSKAAPKEDKVAAGKEPDIQEALAILDQAEQHFSPENTPWYGDSGPLDQYAPGKYQQTTKALRDQLFAVIKRIYKAPGEGQFSDADARAVYGMLFSPERYGDVNRELIRNLRTQLQGRLSGGQAANTDPLSDPLIDKYLKK